MIFNYDVIVVGGGPAGLNAAKYAANSGSRVGLIDSGTRLGGQYWRHSGNEEFDQRQHYDFEQASLLIDAVSANSRVTVHTSTAIWSTSVDNGEVHLRSANDLFTSKKVILATGAYDRSLPFPGWDIPGVMTAGGVQALLKSYGVVAGKRVVVAGTGPFLFPVACGLIEAGCPEVRIFEANSKYAWLKNPRSVIALLRNPPKIFMALTYFRLLRSGKVKVRYNKAIVAAQANNHGNLHSITVADIAADFTVRSSSTVNCDVAAISWGFTPDTSLATALGVKQVVAIDGSVVVSVDTNQETTHAHPGVRIFAAGESTGIGGSDLALIEGAIAGIAASGKSTGLNQLRKIRRRLQSFANALQDVYPVSNGWKSWLTPETIICRCEEVTHKDLQDAINDYGADNPRDIKSFTRCGMGLCQGRTCGRIVSDLLNTEDIDRIQTSNRPIISPITLEVLAQIDLEVLLSDND